MIPTSRLAADLLNIAGTMTNFFGGLLFLYIFLALLPMILQIMLNIFISMIRAQLKMDIRAVLDLLFFPGSLLRITIMWFIMSLYGFEYRMGFTPPDFGESASSVNRRYRGLSYFAFQPNRIKDETNHLKMAFVLSLASYAVLPLVVIMVIFYQNIILTLYYVFPPHLVVPLFNFTIISLGLGGLPVPEETMSIFYGAVYTAPQIILLVIFSILGSLIVAPYIGTTLALILLLGNISIGLMINMSYQADTEDADQVTYDEALKASMMT